MRLRNMYIGHRWICCDNYDVRRVCHGVFDRCLHAAILLYMDGIIPFQKLRINLVRR